MAQAGWAVMTLGEGGPALWQASGVLSMATFVRCSRGQTRHASVLRSAHRCRAYVALPTAQRHDSSAHLSLKDAGGSQSLQLSCKGGLLGWALSSGGHRMQGRVQALEQVCQQQLHLPQQLSCFGCTPAVRGTLPTEDVDRTGVPAGTLCVLTCRAAAARTRATVARDEHGLWSWQCLWAKEPVCVRMRLIQCTCKLCQEQQQTHCSRRSPALRVALLASGVPDDRSAGTQHAAFRRARRNAGPIMRGRPSGVASTSARGEARRGRTGTL